MAKRKQPSRKQIVKKILSSIIAPVKADELVAKVLKKYTPTAKDPKKAIRSYLRELDGELLIFEDLHTVVPLKVAMEGVQYYITFDEFLQQGVLLPVVFSSFTNWYGKKKVQLLDASHRKLDYEETTIELKKQSPLDLFMPSEIIGYSLESWFKENEITNKNIILITIVDWNKHCFSLEVKTLEGINKENNQRFADIVFGMLEKASKEHINIYRTIPTAYYLLKKENKLPCKYWQDILIDDGRMMFDDFCIQYIENTRFGWISEENEEEYALDKKEGDKVYCFKAFLKYEDTIWRSFQIQGINTLADLNDCMMEFFQRDFDHMAGFWKCTQRGKNKRKRYREIELANINPFGEGDGAEIPIATLDMQVGDRLKYVYDFGDWIEHVIELQDIFEPKKKELYPVETGRNKPNYKYCSMCKEKSKKEVAKFICIDCSQEQREVLCCEDCIEEHDGCFLEDILY
ncbi:hypothetical protein [Candidatus Uabimicrobium sp. HlEnr_7]|uniref:IS1096 element passenger TnpR family protein n=1 Tax=Candidatus Uabimicrobium helgolandensis TaxID=3095367 RepID=UPI0035588E99